MFKLTLFSFVLVSSLFLTIDASRKCLMPNFETNLTSVDGLENCKCAEGFEYDEMFGICFKNECKDHCREMDCVIRKSTNRRFEYFCVCPAGYESLSPSFKLKCIPFESVPGHQFVSRNLPKNPLLMKKLNCDQDYEVVNGTYECKCFEGYEMDKATGNCKLKKRCMRRCDPNAVCTVDDRNNTHCVCKTGFKGPNCEENFCNMKNVTSDERNYLEMSIMNVCGTSECILDDYYEFQCKCRPGMQMDSNGFCKVQKPCLPGKLGFESCQKEKNQLCSIRLEEHPFRFKCNCEQSVGYNLQRTCNDYRSKFKPLSNVTHSLKMKVRLDWNEDQMFLSIFSNQLWNLLSVNIDRFFPGWAIEEFLKYEQDVFKSFQHYDFYKPILEDKLRTIFMNGLVSFGHLKKCGTYNVYPSLKYESNLELTKLVDHVFDVDYQIYCERALDVNELVNEFTKNHLISNYVENYFYLNHTGFVISDSIQSS